MSTSVQVTVGILVVLGYLLSPAMLIWGWARWFRQPKLRSLPAILSLLGFILATTSALLAVSAIVYAQVIRDFPYYDPMLMRIFGIGALLSIGGLVLGMGGLWQGNSLRWHAPVFAVATLAFWILSAVGE
jgi:hypothetical protein